MIHDSELKNIIEAAIFAAPEPLSLRKMIALFPSSAQPSKEDVQAVLDELVEKYANSGLELVKLGRGWRFRSKEKYAAWLRKLYAEKSPRFSRAQLETLAIIAYRQPVTRGDIEEVRGVAVSGDIIRVLEARGWISEIGHRDVPGRPALFGTNQAFLEYFGLSSLRELPALMEKRGLDEVAKEMNLSIPSQADSLAPASSEESESTESVNGAEVIPLHPDA